MSNNRISTTGPAREQRMLDLLQRACRGAGSALALWLAGASAASAAVPAANPAEPPMWILKDADSTIYLFGTVHLLDPAITWRTDRVMRALDEAKELWVEVAIPPGGEIQLAMTMVQKALSPGQPLSSRLTETERARLATLLSRTPNGQALGTVIEMTKPWFATVTLGVTPLMSAGYDAESGADTVLTRLAREQGDAVKGLETAEQQIDWIAAGSDAEQLAALKELLAVPDEEFNDMTSSMDEGVRAWMKGDTKPLEQYVEGWRKGEDDAMNAGMSYDTMLVKRNQDWAQQLDQLLDGKGVAFVAVGSGHLVGRDSLQKQLEKRGVKVSRY
jgi:uncharacterized protein YbaP (TraB family)